MAQSSLRRSVLLSSDSSTFCDVCLVEEAVAADAYCTVCNQYLCRSCRRSHQRINETMSHQLRIGSDMYQTPSSNASRYQSLQCGSTSEEAPKCREHRDQDIKYFCEDHDAAICEKCKKFEHRKCTWTSLEDITTKPETVANNKSTLKSLRDLLDEVKGLHCAYDNDLQQFTEQKSDIAKAVEVQHLKINTVVSKWEEGLMDAVESSFEEKSHVVSDHNNILLEMIANTEQSISRLDTAVESSDLEAIILASAARKDIKKYRDVLLDIEGETVVVEMKFEAKEPSRKLTECLNFISQLKITKQMNGKTPQQLFPAVSQLQTRLYADRMAIDDGSICVETTSDVEIPGITGIEVLQDGRVIMCDIFNKKLKLYDANFTFLSEKSLSSRPWRMSLTNIPREVVVTLPDESSLQLAHVDSQGTITTGKKISLYSSKSFFVNGVGDNFVIDKFSRAKCSLLVVNREGKLVKEIELHLPQEFLEGSFVYSCMNEDQTILYFTHDRCGCNGISLAKGDIVFRYQDNRGDAYCAYSGVTTDLDGNVYIGGLATENIVQLNGKGESIKTLVEGVTKLLYIKYVNSRNILFVKQKETNFVRLYQLV